MKRLLLLTALVTALLPLLLVVSPAAAQGISITCADGSSFDNGVEVTVVQQRAGFDYTATVIGLNGFDPVLAVADESGNFLCADDSRVAAGYSADLPTTGYVPPSNLSAQQPFSNTAPSGFADISLIVGGYGNQTGEFLLVFEGMGVTSGDTLGDPFRIWITEDMLASGVPVAVYMIAKDEQLDPLLFLSADDNANVAVDQDGNDIYCDDAGTNSCWGLSESLIGYGLTVEEGELNGLSVDAMLDFPLFGDVGQYNEVRATSYQQATYGQYALAFHFSTAPTGDGQAFVAPVETPETNAPPPASPVPQTGAIGVSVTCDDGRSFDNGVKVIVNQMRSGFTYKATAIGLNGFDPVLAVLPQSGDGFCNDDDSVAAGYSASLPTTGNVGTSPLSAQIFFSQDSLSAFADVSLVVGGFNNSGGEFLLILEGMAVTTGDVVGDAFSVFVTPGMLNSGMPITAYMISETTQLDPLIYLLDANYDTWLDDTGAEISCDDAGNPSLCWGQGVNLSGSYVWSENGRLAGFERDAMLTIPLDTFQSGDVMNLLMTSFNGDTLGQYVLALHMATSDVFTPTA